MSAQLFNRRRFLQAGAAIASLPFLPCPAFGSTLEDEHTAWFRNAKFGMFIHWGPYSLRSVEASWPIMHPGDWKITEAEYRALPQRFQNSERL